MIARQVCAIAAALLLGTSGSALDAAAAPRARGGGAPHFGGGGGFHPHFGGGGFHPHFGGGGFHPHFGGGGFHPHFAGGGFHARFAGGGVHFARAPHFAGHPEVRHFAAHPFATGHFAAVTPVQPRVASHRPGEFAARRLPAVAFRPPAGEYAARHPLTVDPAAFHHGEFSRSAFDHAHRHFHPYAIGWAGHHFWPYAYDQLVDFSFWPYGDLAPYADGLWAYGYDDLFGGVLLPYAYPELAMNAGASAPSPSGVAAQSATSTPASSGVALCGAAEPISATVSIDRIASLVDPTPDQRKKLDALETAETQADKLLETSCAVPAPPTPTARLDAVETRLQVMIDATNTIGAPLDQFYSSLTDEQKARFNRLGETPAEAADQAPGPATLAELCGPQDSVPVVATQKIDAAVRPSAKQSADLAALNQAAARADQMILASCPAEAPLTPPGRLDAIRARLQAMLKGVETVRPALRTFYASLDQQQQKSFVAINEQTGAKG
jgi:Spy/CpxP family protein refolding chaperone